MATLNFIDEIDASVLEWTDDIETSTGRYPTGTEIKDKAKLIYQDLQKSLIWLEKGQELL